MCNFEICEGTYCDVRGIYGFEGSSEMFCIKHRLYGMMQLVEKYERVCKCERRKKPSYKFKGEKPTCCAQCREKGMFNCRARRCRHCDTVASFNYAGQKPEYCGQHRLERMVDVSVF